MYSKNEIIEILKEENSDWLFKKANQVRHDFVGDEIHLRALIEFSNICQNSCKYCGIRKENKQLERYKLSTDKIVETAKKAADYGYKTVVLQSGEGSFYDIKVLCNIISKIKEFDVAVTLSIGEKMYEEYKSLKLAGADRFLLRIETTDENLYKIMHPNMNFQNRKRCLNDLKKLGYEVGTGSLIGLPNQSITSIADDILFFKEINADMVGIGPFIPHYQTPLKNEKKGSFNLALKVMALTRILLPDINIPATTAMETIKENGRITALQSGANVVMPNISDLEYRKKYEIYPDKAGIFADDKAIKSDLMESFAAIGRTIATDYGFRNKHNVA